MFVHVGLNYDDESENKKYLIIDFENLPNGCYTDTSFLDLDSNTSDYDLINKIFKVANDYTPLSKNYVAKDDKKCKETIIDLSKVNAITMAFAMSMNADLYILHDEHQSL